MGSQVRSDLKFEIDEILKEVVKSKNIVNYELKPNLEAQVGDGFTGEFYTAEVVDSDSGEIISVAIKKAPKVVLDNTMLALFKNEATFYSLTVPALDSLQKRSHLAEPFDNVPELYCYGLEPTKEYFAMENLKTKGYVLFDKKAYLNKEHLEFIFKVYGRFHALSFVLRKQNVEEYNKIHNEYVALNHEFEDMALEHIKATFAAIADASDPASAVYDVARTILEDLKELFLKVLTYTGGYRCTIHGDCWSNNMMFKYSESGKLEDVKVLDFQAARDGSPIHDLSYFFYSGASKSDMDNIEYYLKIYHNSLSEVIKQLGEDPEVIFPYDAFILEWKEYAIFGIIMGVYLWQAKLLPKEDCVDFVKAQENSTTKDRMGNFAELLSQVSKDDAFRERASALLIHAHEFGVLRKQKVMKTSDVAVPEEVATTHL